MVDVELDAGGGGVQVLSQMSTQSDGEHPPECLVCLPQKEEGKGGGGQGGRRGVFAGWSYLNLSVETVVLVLMGAARQAQTRPTHE